MWQYRGRDCRKVPLLPAVARSIARSNCQPTETTTGHNPCVRTCRRKALRAQSKEPRAHGEKTQAREYRTIPQGRQKRDTILVHSD
eukprot:5365242-Amphidinium_carterae.1